MKTMIRAAVLAVSFLLLAVGHLGTIQASPAGDKAALHAVDRVWFKAYNAAKPEVAAKLYAENAILMPPNAPAAHGRSAIRKFLEGDMAASAKAGVTLIELPHSDAGAVGDLGWVSGSYEAKDKAGKVVDTGKFLSVSRKVGGKWLYIRDTWNSDGAPMSTASEPNRK